MPTLVFQILRGSQDLTGDEMTHAYRTGSCAMRTVLMQRCQDPLEELNRAFLDAVITKELAWMQLSHVNLILWLHKLGQ